MTDLSLKVQAALAQLDPSNNDHWTDDGLPKTSVVQTIAKDTTIKRSDIQAARPGYDRSAAKGDEPPVEAAQAPKPKPPAPPPAPQQEAKVSEETVEISDAQLHAILDKRVKSAEAKIENGRTMVGDGVRMQETGQDELRQARIDKNKYFPPMKAAENIRGAINDSNAERAARVAAARRAGYANAPGASQLDRARTGGNARGWNPGAQSRGAYSRKEAARLGFRVPGSGGVKA